MTDFPVSFDPLDYPHASRRTVVYAKNGMTCAGNPTAASVGLQTLLMGGNAVDAAVAMAATQPLVEPACNGLGSDAFVMVWKDGKLHGLNASGPAPAAASIEACRAKGFEAIPKYGVCASDVPGAVSAWSAVHERFGRLSFADVMAPAICYAEDGYPVSPTIADLWARAFRLYSGMRDDPQFEPWFEHFAPEGRAPRAGEIFRSPEMGATLRAIAETHGEAFYRGEIAEKIGAFYQKHGGFMTADDLARYHPEWVDPISINYRGYDVWEMPPNGHGITVLMALKILAGLELPGRLTAETMHRQIEAMKLAMSDTAEHVTEPSSMRVTVDELLSDEYTARRRALIGETAILPEAGDPRGSNTVYFCAADRDGMMVSFIQSNYMGFGSGIVVPGTGVSMNNRVANFRMDPKHANCLEGGKRPYHTIIPGFLTKDGEAVGPFGIMGGFMQPQAHVQVVENLIDWHLNPQQALDAPRWQWTGGRKVDIESDVPASEILKLQRRGHEITVKTDLTAMGRGQMILRSADGTLVGATEKRTDGQIMCY
ncbi:gamma-glutamyltransferase family protein [Sutterella sp.]|uniref:gamma-glutamyltransferase family protein n=1 Tax=Sutterella sp. TaxID=1981025 RepID=UPI0026DED01C|nr:gamma-glutamyltransferase family protein [Sutterella sp.]MDO5531555.1 gamma-glutamyltransferase family protein [Sutterella sp.]